ncbi:MAG: chromosomal replication initiator protein DnaA [Oscillospiraceae bacterium]|nr:chromosomal replication initiator protein DnaA [Oscillospiraceae bacterium]
MPSATYLWAKAINYIEQKHSAAVITTWFDDVDVIEFENNTLVLFSPNDFRRPILEEQCRPMIRDAMASIGYPDVNIMILDEKQLEEYRNRGKINDANTISSEFTFDNFIVGPSNQFAHGAAVAVANNPANAYNPLLIYGESGLGKTHLLYAIANAIRQDHPEFNIVYVNSEDFTNELISAIQLGKNVEFRSKYRTADLLLIDDIQFIAGKESTQMEFFHTFNTLYEHRKQIVLTSDRPPEEMSKLEERLKTRLQWGLQADIQPPDYETRVAIIQNKSSAKGMKLPTEVITYVAENITSNVRQLEGTVNKIMAYTNMNDFEMNRTNVSRAIKDMFKGKESFLPTPQLVISEVSAYYNISESILRGKARDKTTAEARQVSMYLIRNLTSLSLEDIALEFGKDHSTVLHSINKIESALPGSKHLQTVIREITINVNGRL